MVEYFDTPETARREQRGTQSSPKLCKSPLYSTWMSYMPIRLTPPGLRASRLLGWVFPHRPVTAPPSRHSCSHKRLSGFHSPQPNIILSLRQVPESNADILDLLQNGGSVPYSFSVPKDDAYVIWGRVSPSATGLGSFFVGVDVPAGNSLVTKPLARSR